MKIDKSILLFIFIFFVGIDSTHLCAEDFPEELFQKRRLKLMDSIGQGIAILQNPSLSPRTNDVNYYPYRANSDFYYLTGFDGPDAVCILLPEAKTKFILFVEPKNAITAQWFGDVPGIEGAMKTYAADTAYAIGEFETVLKVLLKGKENIFYDFKNTKLSNLINSLIQEFHGQGPAELVNISNYIHEMRIIKDDHEITLIRKAVDISCAGHLEVMKAITPGMYEYEIASIFNYMFRQGGAMSNAYESMVASGPNSTVFHYSKLGRQIQKNDLVLMDMGAEFEYYTADITRVLPISGRFSPEQKRIYEIVLDMQAAIIDRMKPGNKIYECLKPAEAIAKNELYKLGLITDKDTRWQHYLYYFPYTIHAIGLDVHDVGDYDSMNDGGRTFMPGMVFAIEPMLYIGDNLVESFRLGVSKIFSITEEELDQFFIKIEPAFKKYRQIAARVEDNILITENGNENLSANLPRTVAGIEKILSKESFLNRR